MYLWAKLGLRFPESGTKCILQLQMLSVMGDVHKGTEHPLSNTLREEWCPALLAIAPQIMEETPRKPMLPVKIILAFHFMWFDWNDMVTKVPVPLASGITNVPPPDFCSILQNLRFGVFTLLPEYLLRYCRFTALAGGGNRRGGGVQTMKVEETGENPCHGKQAGSKTEGGEGTWDPIPAKEVDETLLCGAANGDRVRFKKMFTIVGGPPPLRASDGLATCWAYHSQGGCSSNCDRKWDHCPSAAEDLGPRQEYAKRIQAKL